MVGVGLLVLCGLWLVPGLRLGMVGRRFVVVPMSDENWAVFGFALLMGFMGAFMPDGESQPSRPRRDRISMEMAVGFGSSVSFGILLVPREFVEPAVGLLWAMIVLFVLSFVVRLWQRRRLLTSFALWWSAVTIFVLGLVWEAGG